MQKRHGKRKGPMEATANSEPGVPERAERAAAREISARGVATFAALMEELSAIRGHQTDIARALEEFALLLEGGADGGGGISALPGGLREMHAALEGFARGTSDRATGADAAAARGAIAEIARCGRALAAVATLSRTTAVAAGIRALDDYLDALKATAGRIGRAAQDVLWGLDALVARAGTTVRDCRHGAHALDRLAPGIAERVDALGRIGAEERRLSDEVAAGARRCGAEGRRALTGFVSAMQFSDRLAQRLAHVEEMLAHADTHVDRLAAAQAACVAEAIEGIAADVGATLDTLGGLARDGAELLSGADVAAAARATLSARSELIDTALGELGALDGLVRRAEAEAGRVSETAEEARASFRRLEASATDLSRASVNAALVAARSGDARGPLSALSGEVRAIATRSLRAVGAAEARLARVADGASGALAAVSEAGAGLRQALEAARSQSEADAARLARLEALSRDASGTADALIALLSAARTRLSGLDGVRAELAELATGLDRPAPAAPPDTALLDRIHAAYTMDEERQVHAALFGGGAGPAPPPAPETVDIDDLLF